MKPESSVIFFPCKNIEETKKYYTTVLGLPVYKDLGSSVWFDCGYGYLALWSRPAHGHRPVHFL